MLKKLIGNTTNPLSDSRQAPSIYQQRLDELKKKYPQPTLEEMKDLDPLPDAYATGNPGVNKILISGKSDDNVWSKRGGNAGPLSKTDATWNKNISFLEKEVIDAEKNLHASSDKLKQSKTSLHDAEVNHQDCQKKLNALKDAMSRLEALVPDNSKDEPMLLVEGNHGTALVKSDILKNSTKKVAKKKIAKKRVTKKS